MPRLNPEGFQGAPHARTSPRRPGDPAKAILGPLPYPSKVQPGGLVRQLVEQMRREGKPTPTLKEETCE